LAHPKETKMLSTQETSRPAAPASFLRRAHPLDPRRAPHLRHRRRTRQREPRRRLARPGLVAEIRALLLKHKVLFFRDQDITRAEHVAFARHFGELEDHPVAGSDPENPGLVRSTSRPTPNDRYENAWHTDATWREKPPFGCVLRCVECPPVGGDTMWANMALAYEKLPQHVKEQIAGLRARHSIEASFGAAMPIEKRLALKAQFPDAEHPVVRTHPETGEKILFVNAFTTHFTNFHTPENVRYGQDYTHGAAMLLRYLVSQARSPSTRCASAGSRTTWPCGTTGPPSTTR
jgi:taurine dioxygenase